MINEHNKQKQLKAWQIIDQALSDLVQNQDIQEQTPREYIIGYLITQMQKEGILQE